MNDFKQTQIRLEDKVVHYTARSKKGDDLSDS